MCRLWAVAIVLQWCIRIVGAATHHSVSRSPAVSLHQERTLKVLILDVDGTLYGPDAGIEQQIVRNIHKFAAKHLHLSPEQCEQLHAAHGSTFEGLVQQHALTPELVKQFFSEVYSDIDLAALSCGSEGDATGYRHRTAWSRVLQALPCPKCLASNSPREHVDRVLHALGLDDTQWDVVLCGGSHLTKADGKFYESILAAYPPELGWECVLLDDSAANLRVAAACGMRTLHIDNATGSRKLSDGARRSVSIQQGLAW